MATNRTRCTEHRPSRALALLLVAGALTTAASTSLLASPASAGGPVTTPISVTTTLDVVDPADGLLSLREAFTQANADGLANDVVLQQGVTYVLDLCAGGVDENVIPTSPPRSAATAGALPLYGTCTILIPAIDAKVSVERCTMVPLPEEA